MSKRHKGNLRYSIRNNKNNKISINDFYAREQKLNRLISNFVYCVKNGDLSSIEEYEGMNKKRLEIKRLLFLQSGELWKQSYRRKRFYYKQENKFKYFYVMWKRKTYYIYLYVRFDVPLRLSQSLSYYEEVSHDISQTIFLL